MIRKSHFALGIAALLALAFPCSPQHADVAKTTTFNSSKFPTFTFQELPALSREEHLSRALDAKLSYILHSAVLDNSYPTASGTRIQVKGAGPALRVAEWNIERGENFDWVVLALKAGVNSVSVSVCGKIIRASRSETSIE